MSRVVISELSDALGRTYDDFVTEFGIGPCGAYAALKREEGWGNVAVCTANDKTPQGHGFGHYVIWDDGIIDLANPFDNELHYSDVEILNADEMPECISRREIDWLRTRGV